MNSFRQEPGIYRITNILNDKNYIGSSINISTRISAHKLTLKNKKHHNVYLQNSYDKYGHTVFKFEVIEYCKEEELLNKEEYYINIYKSTNDKYGYNIGLFTNGRKRHSIKVREKISKAHTGRKRNITKEWGENISKANKGRKISETQKENIRKCKTGTKRKPFSQTWKTNIGNAHRKFLITIIMNNKIIKEKITFQECAKFLKVSTRTIYQATQLNYKCKNYKLIKIKI